MGAYRLIRELGAGATGVVYEAEHTQWQMRVAIKLLHTRLAANGSARARLLREVFAAAQICHPHVVRVFDAGISDDGIPYVIMELLEGMTLAGLLENTDRLEASRAVDLILPIASAMASAHRVGIIHRDLKPGNIVIANRGMRSPDPVVTDFGTSKVLGSEPDEVVTSSDRLLGTLPYMAPEQTRGASRATAASDQYALAAILYECLTGRRPFAEKDPYQLMHAIVTSEIVPMRELVPDIDPQLEHVVLRALARSPSARYPSVSEFGRALLPWSGARARALWTPELADADPCPSGQPLCDAESPASHAHPGSGRAGAGRTFALGAVLVVAVVGIAIPISRRGMASSEPAALAGHGASCAPCELRSTMPPASIGLPLASAVAASSHASGTPPAADAPHASDAPPSSRCPEPRARVPNSAPSAPRLRERRESSEAAIERGRNGAAIVE